MDLTLLEALKNFDQQCLLYLNSKHSPLLDEVMLQITDRFFWIPFYLILVIFILWNLKKKGLYTLLFIGLLVLATDQISSTLLKPKVARLRPCHEPAIIDKVRIIDSCGGQFGFVSSHAANCFGIAVFLILIFREKHKWTYLLLIWASIVSYSRIYLGKHYPGDILGGMVVGIVTAYLFYKLYNYYFYSKALQKGNE